MKFCGLFTLMLAAILLPGCKKSARLAPVPAPATTNATVILPTAAQPKLKTIKLWIGAEELSAEMALTGIQMQTGMMFRTNIPENEGMIFVLPYPQRASFWMKNCPESLSAAYITADGAIQEIHHFEKQDTNAVVATNDNIQFVLETKDGWFQRHNINTGVVVRTEFGPLDKIFLQKR
jgi:uncharacterized membrane protein (UPF0127 family)